MAKKFVFRLESILGYRKGVEDEKKRDFALAQAAVVKRQREIAALEGERERHKLLLSSRQLAGAGRDEVLLFEGYISNLWLKIIRAGHELAKLGQESEKKRLVLVEARRKRKALELLKERRRRDYMTELGRDEQKLIDDIRLSGALSGRDIMSGEFSGS